MSKVELSQYFLVEFVSVGWPVVVLAVCAVLRLVYRGEAALHVGQVVAVLVLVVHLVLAVVVVTQVGVVDGIGWISCWMLLGLLLEVVHEVLEQEAVLVVVSLSLLVEGVPPPLLPVSKVVSGHGRWRKGVCEGLVLPVEPSLMSERRHGCWSWSGPDHGGDAMEAVKVVAAVVRILHHHLLGILSDVRHRGRGSGVGGEVVVVVHVVEGEVRTRVHVVVVAARRAIPAVFGQVQHESFRVRHLSILHHEVGVVLHSNLAATDH